VYCSAKSGFIPGLNGGVFTPALDLQLRQTIRNLLANLEEAGLTFKDVVSTNVYLDDLSDFQAMKELYAKYFGAIFPARTTIQQIAPVERTKKSDDSIPRSSRSRSLLSGTSLTEQSALRNTAGDPNA
jgi:hypothetical protein